VTPVELVAGLAAFSLAVLLLCSVLPVWLELRRHNHRARRRGGYLRPRASVNMRDGGQRTPGMGTTARISSSSRPGLASVARDILLPPLPPSRPTAPTSSGNATGVAGASGAQALAKRVGSDE
jgi:hypothetical protein